MAAVVSYVLTACVLLQTEGREVTVVRFQADGEASTTSLLDTGLTHLPAMTQMTLCLHLRLQHSSKLIPLVSYYANQHDNELFIGILWDTNQLRVSCCNAAVKLLLNKPFPLYLWHHLCLALDLTALQGVLVLNGEVLRIDIDQARVGSSSRLEIMAGQRLVVGQEMDSLDGDFDITQILDGDIADYRLYSEALTVAEMEAFTTCKEDGSNLREPLISLNNDRLRIRGPTATRNETVDIICEAAGDYTVLLPKLVSFNEGIRSCAALKGTVALPKNAEENQKLQDGVASINSTCEGMYKAKYWVGSRRNLETGEWVKSNDDIPISWRDIKYPSLADSWKNCLVTGSPIYPYTWLEAPCTEYARYCTICNFTYRPALRLRGLCKLSLFDRKLHLNEYENHQPKFDGTENSRIIWEDGKWVMETRLFPDVRAEMKSRNEGDLPIGLHNWTIHGDTCGEENKVQLLLTACGEEEYTCGDGACIAKHRKCNSIIDCPDQSDELHCDLVLLPMGYSVDASPPRLASHPLPIYFFIQITSIRTFDLAKFTIAIDATWTSKWHDSRLTFSNLQENHHANLVKKWQTLWTPGLLMTDGTQSLVEMSGGVGVVYVKRDTEPLNDNDEHTAEGDMYSGQDNRLVFQQQATLTFHCHFQLLMYPFDTQRCSIHFTVHTLTQDQGGLVQVELELRNHFRYYIANAFVPSLMLVLICCLTLWFRLDDFSDRIMVTLTSMLVLASFFSQTSQDIPKTAYLKVIDVWYLVLISQVFCIILALVYVENLRLQSLRRRIDIMEAKQKSPNPPSLLKSPEKMNNVLRTICLSTVVVVIVVFAIIGMTAVH